MIPPLTADSISSPQVSRGARITPMQITRVLPVLAVLVVLGAAAGCEKPLFPKEAPRSPYDRYLMLRGQQRSQTVENAYGGEVPSIRDRLRPLGSP